MTQWSEQVSFTSEIVGSILSLLTYVKRVSQRSAESRGFSLGIPVSSHRESLRFGHTERQVAGTCCRDMSLGQISSCVIGLNLVAGDKKLSPRHAA